MIAARRTSTTTHPQQSYIAKRRVGDQARCLKGEFYKSYAPLTHQRVRGSEAWRIGKTMWNSRAENQVLENENQQNMDEYETEVLNKDMERR